MDYLDPRKRRRHTIMLYVGYALIGIGIAIATTVLVYQAYGFGIDRKGAVIQSGLLFVSSQPQPASIYIDGELIKSKTNTRLKLPAETYQLKIQRANYHDWTRTVEIEGGSVNRFDYPLLIPKELVTKQIADYETAPAFATQSPDKRWLIISRPAEPAAFDVYDLRSPTKAPVGLTLPESIYTAGAAAQSWELVEWADDNSHVLMRHLFEGGSEYVLLDREAPAKSINLTRTLDANPTKLQLIDRKFDKYYLYDAEQKTLGKASLEAPEVLPVLAEVLDYKPYADDTILYATTLGASSGQTRIRLLTGTQTYTIRSVTASPTYLLDITTYDRAFYVVTGASIEDKVYIYKDPARQIGTNVFKSPVPTQVLRVKAPNFVSFSSSAQYVMIENGAEFAVYDIEYEDAFQYTAKLPLDAPQANAVWMDGNRLTYVSGGKRIIFDYDNRNVRELGEASAQYRPFFAPDFTFSYALTTGPDGKTVLNQTALLAPGDL